MPSGIWMMVKLRGLWKCNIENTFFIYIAICEKYILYSHILSASLDWSLSHTRARVACHTDMLHCSGGWSLGHYIMGTLSHTGHSSQSCLQDDQNFKMTLWPSFLRQMPRRASNLISPFAVFRNWRKASAAPAFPSCQRDFNTLIRDWELRLTLLSLSSMTSSTDIYFHFEFLWF